MAIAASCGSFHVHALCVLNRDCRRTTTGTLARLSSSLAATPTPTTIAIVITAALVDICLSSCLVCLIVVVVVVVVVVVN